MGVAVFPAEYGTFGEHRKPIECSRPRHPNHSIRQHPVVEGDVDAIVIAVKGDGLHIDVTIQKFCTAHPGIGTGIQQSLRTCGEKDPQVFNAVFIPAGIGDFSCADGHGLTQILGIAAQGIQRLF